MQQTKYRFNRKEGKIYVDRQDRLVDSGNSIKVIILWASEPIFGKPFPYLPAQYWVQLTFFDEHGNWCHAVLNNGTTNALSSWLAYRKEIETVKKLELCAVITTIGFESIDCNYQCFDYSFSGIAGKEGLGDRMRLLIQQSEYPLVEPIGLVGKCFAFGQ